MNNYQNPKISENSVGCSPPSCFRTGHVIVLSTPPGCSTLAFASTGVPAHLISVLPVWGGRSKENN